MLCVACVQRRSLGGIKSAANDPLVAAGALARASRCQPVVWDYPNLPRRRMHHLQRLTDPSPHNWEVQIMDLMRNSGLDPVPHRLGVQLEDPGDVVDREQRVGGVPGSVHGRVTLARRHPRRRRLEIRHADRSTTKEVVEIRSTSMNTDDPIVEEVLRCEDLPPGSLAGRRMIVRWSDGTEGEAVRFYQDEVAFQRGRPGRQDPRADQVAALPPRPRLAAVLARRPGVSP